MDPRGLQKRAAMRGVSHQFQIGGVGLARGLRYRKATRRAGLLMLDDNKSDPRPYRPNVGIAVFNAQGLVLIGRRFRDDGPEIILPGLEWQMPQGGIDPQEEPRVAVMRELWEETGIAAADYLGETEWLTYDFPPYDGPPHRLGHFRGQRQKWFALRYAGRDDEIDPLTTRNGQPPEFDAWRWERLDRVADLVVPFRREVYRAVAQSFAKFV
jgi:putative (di)nucleoside polyphosphate hydrolase